MLNQLRTHSIFDVRSKPYTLLGFAGFFMALISFLPMKTALDINMHDTYFVISYASIFEIFAVLLLLLWSTYLVTSRLTLSRRLCWLHVLATLLPIIYFVMSNSRTWGISGVPKRYYAFTEFQSQKRLFDIIVVYIALILTLFIGQIIFVINLTFGIIRYFRKVESNT